jgi:hypothetical protein
MHIDKWTAFQVYALIVNSERANSDKHELKIIAFDDKTKSVLGIDTDNFIVFSAPQYSEFEGFKFPRANLECNKTIELTNGVKIEPVFSFKFLSNSDEEINTISTIFAGLQNQILESGNTQSAQNSAIGFESYFHGLGRIKPSRQLQVGLFGELAFILNSENKGRAITAWHESPYSTYDFGFQSDRLEVKTTTSPTRLHWLRSSQTLELDRQKLTYLSIYAPEVESGVSVNDLIQKLSSSLQASEKMMLLTKLDLYDLENADMRFDLESAISSFKFIDGMDVPLVDSSEPSIRNISWQCDFGLLRGQDRNSSWN